jgi:F420-0:gamma-glutamyl ligase-like protein
MTRYYALALRTNYWKPKTDFVEEIVKALKGKVAEGDFVVVSEKAISTAKAAIIDETVFEPTFFAKALATLWMPVAWGHFLGVLCHFGQRLLRRLKEYPTGPGSRHKQVALQYAGLWQALMFGSEGGIDGSNLPFSLVSFPLKTASQDAEIIRQKILETLRRKVTVIIVDSDKTYSFRNFHFTPRPRPMKGISSHGGIFAYIMGRVLKLRRRPTPLALSGSKVTAEDAIAISNVADKARGPGSGATVWDMAARFKVSTTGVTWDMLTQVKHKPIVIVRRASRTRNNCVLAKRYN